jgi:ribosomal protein L7Ae-like RNA K-turn-binding protein
MSRAIDTERAFHQRDIDPRIQRLVGLARKAGSVAVGLRATEKSLRRGDCRLVLLAEDASTRTTRIVRRSAERIPVVSVKSQQTLGGWIGSPPVAVVAITQKNLAKAIEEAACVPSNA